MMALDRVSTDWGARDTRAELQQRLETIALQVQAIERGEQQCDGR